jgi:pyridinium-3,5-biscarboxylic acid mononucleotide synthase
MFDEQALRELLGRVANASISVDEAFKSLRILPFENLGFAHIDHHRAIRQGFPEVVFCAGKSPSQVSQIFAQLAEYHEQVLGTRAAPEHFEQVRQLLPDVQYNPQARVLWLDRKPERLRKRGVVIVAGGTSDLPVVQEAEHTLDLMGHAPDCICDVGVAGLHRLLQYVEVLQAANVIIVVAGMEGALPSVVGGLVAVPVIAVPTSVGYGASFAGLAALLGMLNSCSPGVAVVNIDNGYGAGCLAAMINQRSLAGTAASEFSEVNSGH